MFGVGKGKKSGVLGIDIGASGIKLVELVPEDGRVRLHTYAYVDRAISSMEKNPIDAVRDGALIKSMLAKARVRSRTVQSSVATAHVFSSVISIPATDEKAVRDLVLAQARKLVPIPLEDMHVDFKILERQEKSVTVLLTGAANTQVQQIVRVFEAAGLKLATLEPEAFGLIRSLVGRDLAPIAIVDVGGLRTNIIIVDRGVPVLLRSISVGGLSFTKAVGAATSVALEQAERIKLDATTAEPYATIVGTITNEIKYLLQGFADHRNEAGKIVDKLVLTGGSARLFGLADAIGRATAIRTFVGDPWARVAIPDGFPQPLLDQIGPRFAVAIGLAMRG